MDAMSIKQLRQVIVAAGLKHDDCIEKSDLKQRAKEALQITGSKNAAQPPKEASAATETRMLGGYECFVSNLDPENIDTVVIILHGFGATNNDFIPLSKMFAKPNIGFVFPQARAGGAMGATQWWTIDVMKWMGAMQSGEQGIAKLIRDKPPGLDECRAAMTQLLQQVREPFKSPPKIILGGFSQGAMTAMDIALSHDDIHHIMAFSGAPIVVEEWSQKLLQDNRGSKIKMLLSHGQSDPVLPFVASTWTKELFTKHGANVQYETHPGGHELGNGVLRAVESFLAS